MSSQEAARRSRPRAALGALPASFDPQAELLLLRDRYRAWESGRQLKLGVVDAQLHPEDQRDRTSLAGEAGEVVCKGLGELSLGSFGWRWRSLRKLVFEIDGSNYRFLKEFGNAGVCGIDAGSESLQVLLLTNCVVAPRRGLSSVLARCGGTLVELELNMCLGLRDEQLISLAEACSQLKSLTLRFSSMYEGSTRISNASFYALATHCVLVEKACIAFGSGAFGLVTAEGIAFFIQRCCLLRELVLENVFCLDDEGMEAVCSSDSLESLELVTCDRVSDRGIAALASSKLRKLRLCRCSGITGEGLGVFAGSRS